VKQCVRFLSVSCLALCVADKNHAALTRYDLNTNGGLAGFNATTANAPVSVDFESIAPGTDISGVTIDGVQFNVPLLGAPLIVVRGNDTFTPAGFSGVVDAETNKLFPTTGDMVLSPGGLTLAPGPNNPVENDDLELVFPNPLRWFGFDVLFQSADVGSNTSIQVFNQANISLFSGNLPASNSGQAGAPGGAAFWGAVVTGPDLIARIVVNEVDNNAGNPDSNIGFDSLRIRAALPGDYNDDGKVDAADYVTWRKNEGAPAGTLPNDIDGGTIGPPQYDTWRAHFGEPSNAGAAAAANSSSNAAVPEPSSLILLTFMALVARPPRHAR
jgi:hypothetical protein